MYIYDALINTLSPGLTIWCVINTDATKGLLH